MAVVDINWSPSQKELRQFSVLWLVFFGAIGLYFWLVKGADWGRYVALVSLLGVPGFFLPAMMKPIFITWMVLAFPIGWTISHLLLGGIYYLVFTPIGLLLRALGTDPMNRKLDREAETYWTKHESADDVSRYFRQF